MEISRFGSGIPKEVKETWTIEHNGTAYTFGKDRKSPKHFVYYCRRDISDGRFVGASSTGFETDRDLSRVEIERRQQFIDFMNGTR